MTVRKIRVPASEVTEDAFGTPPVARGGMMKVAGKTDDLKPGEELLTDEGDGMDTMKGPVYSETTQRLSIGDLRGIIRRALR